MKDFLKFMFASMLGFIIVLVVVFFILVGIIASLASFAEKKAVQIEPKTLLLIKLDQPVTDRAPKDPFSMFSSEGFNMEQNPGLDEILKNLDKAKSDPAIKGIYMDLGMVPSGLTILREIRQALLDFKTSGKFILAYGEVYSQSAYYLGSVADKVYLNPDGAVEFRGIDAEIMFLKGTLEKLDINMQVIRHGKYKSAVEMFTLDKMSDPNREQMNAMIDGMWGSVLADISASRNISPQQLNLIADNLDALDADKALAAKLVDGLLYKDQVLAELKTMTGLGEKDKIATVSLAKYTSVNPTVKEKISANKIAVIYAIGNIIDGKGDDRSVGSVKMSEAIRQARENDKVKAIVLRVNSPGGSATASEVIRREVELAVKVKPVVVSMGDVAASGGYWISASATKILADPSTITGSIGVFGLVPNMKGLFENKLGITFDHAMTNKLSDFPSVTRPLTGYETIIFERQIDKIYNNFLSLVSTGRKIDRSQVDSIGQGRVWCGKDALKLHLIDQFGGLQDAIRLAAELASVKDYNILSLPAQKDPFQQILDELTGNVSSGRMEKELGEYYPIYEYLKQIKDYQGIQARLPYEITVK
jgi:protease-4